MNNLSEKLKCLRKNAGLSQKELANKLGLSASTIAMIESGKRQGTKDTLLKLAQFFEVSIDYLYGNETINDNTNQKNRLIDDFLNNLIEEKIITDPNNIDKETVEMILNAVKAEVALKLKKKNR